MRLPATLTGTLLCLFALCGCEQPQVPGSTAGLHTSQEPPTPPEKLPAAPKPHAVPAAQSGDVMSAPASRPPDLESLVLTPEDRPFADTTTRNFGDIPGTGWLAAPPGGTTQSRLLPDMFRTARTQRRINIEGELLLDETRETSKMLDGVGMKVEISTD